MKSIGTCFFATAMLLLSGCATIEAHHDMMCSEIAAFANATHDASIHSVVLKADWGGRFEPKDSGTFVMAAKHCSFAGYVPGQKLCDYLLPNTSTEFPEINLNRALSCLGVEDPPSSTSLEYVNLKVWSYSAAAVNANIRLGIEFASSTDDSPSSLKIIAERLEGL